MITNLSKLVTAAALALTSPALRAQELLLLNLDTSRSGSPRALAVSCTGAPDTAATFLVLGFDQLFYPVQPEIPLFVQPVVIVPFGPSRTITLPVELLAPTAPVTYLQALSHDAAMPAHPWAHSKTWRLEQGRADALGIDPALATWLVSTDSIPPQWTLMAKADVLPGARSLRAAGITRLAGATRVDLRLTETATDDQQQQTTVGVPLGSAPGVEVAVYYGSGAGPLEQVALLPTR